MSTWAIPSYAEWAVPGYTEDRLLGHGVSGRVVAAVNDANGQRVAIKYLNEDLVRDSEFLGEFRSGTERLISLNAPHVAGVFDYAEQPGAGAAIVTELVEGVSLRRMIARRGPLSAKAALVVFKDSLLGLAAAHSRQVAHRDVKPDNVLIDATGWCTLTDFGIAVQTDKQVPVPGTPEYMAPELWNGAPNFPATDVYAATIVLCESLTGKPPFSGRPARLREQHETASVPLDQYDPPLRDLIGWGLAKYSDRRPPSAWAFAGELDARAADAYGPYWEDEGRRELAERAQELLALPAGDGGDSAGVTRRARRKLVAFVSVAAVAIVVLGAVGAVALSKKPPVKVALSSVSAADVSAAITESPPVVVSKCNTPSTFTFKGSVTDLQPGKVSYQWQYSSGKLGPVETLNFTGAGEQPVTSGAVSTTHGGRRVGSAQPAAQPRHQGLEQGHVLAAVQHGQQRHHRVGEDSPGGAEFLLLLGPAPDPDRHRHDHRQERGTGHLLLADVQRDEDHSGPADLQQARHAVREPADVPGLGAADRVGGTRGDQAGRRDVQDASVDGDLPEAQLRRARPVDVGHQGFREPEQERVGRADDRRADNRRAHDRGSDHRRAHDRRAHDRGSDNRRAHDRRAHDRRADGAVSRGWPPPGPASAWPLAARQPRYSSSVTCGPQCGVPSVMDRWVMKCSGLAPCQCSSPSGVKTTSPGLSSTFAWPLAWTRPRPSVT